MFTCCLLLVFAGLTQALPADKRIVNGTNAKPGEFPYIVSLRDYRNKHICGGSILDNEFILTAAHCVHGMENFPMFFNIQYGITQISPDYHQVIRVEKIKCHEYYQPSLPLDNDIAILKLVEPIPDMNGLVRSTILPPAFYQTPGGQDAVVAGWGVLFWGSEERMENLQRVDLIVYPDENCLPLPGIHVNTKLHFCAGVPEGGKADCKGDSGGPLTVNGVQVGIVSWSDKPCGARGKPGVYTKVSTYVDWIKTNMDIMRQ